MTSVPVDQVRIMLFYHSKYDDGDATSPAVKRFLRLENIESSMVPGDDQNDRCIVFTLPIHRGTIHKHVLEFRNASHSSTSIGWEIDEKMFSDSIVWDILQSLGFNLELATGTWGVGLVQLICYRPMDW